MGLQHRLKFLYTVFIVYVLCDCFAFDFIGKNSMRSQENQVLGKRNQHLFNTKSNFYNTTNSVKQQPYMKWEENGITENNYGMINYFWRNMKADKNVESTTASHQINRRHYTFISRYKSQSSTPSYIEFYYLDDDVEQSNIKNGSFNRLDGLDSFKPSTSTLRSTFSFRLNGPYIRRVLVNPRTSSILRNFQKSLLYPHIQTVNESNIEKRYKLKHKVRSSEVHSRTMSGEVTNNKTVSVQKIVTVKNFLNAFQVLTTKTASEQQTALKLQILASVPTLTTIISTTPDDRVKFFEMYDNNTLQPPEKDKKLSKGSEIESLSDDTNIPRNKNSTEDNNNHVNRRHCDNTHREKYEKKRINFISFSVKSNSTVENQIQESNALKAHNTIANNSPTSEDMDNITMTSNKFLKSGVITVKIANWSSYPFASVYVYKPTQTHCDAAGISPHWLVASGSCLSRHSLMHSVNARSAYVTYCGEHWQLPERIAYVKRSVVHPKFSPRDELRRLPYNIGLIQVSSSMAASCTGWSPITLMSHQFTAEPAGSMASAVGWGLDRYGTKYSSESLPHWPLTVYDAPVFCGACPGSTKFSVARRRDVGANNVYCLLLPPYAGEESDPVHGGLLLVGGKLIALYLQEERRSWGAQSAQYTGVWRLLPWVLDMAREPDDEAALDI